ncbi:MAG: hypothetical protein ACE5HV_00105 [Acidobacteriota bacterium]
MTDLIDPTTDISIEPAFVEGELAGWLVMNRQTGAPSPLLHGPTTLDECAAFVKGMHAVWIGIRS